jgi:cellulose synthase operon protein C
MESKVILSRLFAAINLGATLRDIPPPEQAACWMQKKSLMRSASPICSLILTFTMVFIPITRIGHAQSKPEQAVVEKARSLESRGLTDLAAQTWQQVLLSQPGNTEALAALAQAAKRQGKDAEAGRYLQRLQQINPDDPRIATIQATVTSKVYDARRAQAEAQAAAHNYVGAMQVYRQLYGGHPPNEAAIEYYETEAATDTGRSHAIAGLRSLARLHPGEERYQATLGRVLTYNPKTRAEGERMLQQMPRNAEARAALRQALLWDAQNPASATAVKHYLNVHPDAELSQHLQETQTRPTQQPNGAAFSRAEQAAYAELDANNLYGAEQAFRALLEINPGNSRALAGLGFVHMKQSDFVQAVGDLEAARRNGSKDPAVETALDTAHFWLIMGDGAKAVEDAQMDTAVQRYREALALRPSSPEAFTALAGTLLRAHQSTEASEVYARWLKLQPSSAAAWHGLFTAQAQAGQIREALATSKHFPPAVDSTLASDPSYLLGLADVYRTAGDGASAGRVLQQALNLPFAEGGRKMPPELQLQYAAVLAATRHLEQAAGLYEQVAVEQPSNLAAWHGLVLSQHQMHDDESAVASIERMSPATYASAQRDPDFLSLSASIYQQQGRSEEAERLLQQAEAILVQQGNTPSNDRELQIAAIERQRNRPQAAATLYRRVIAADPRRVTAWNGLLSALHQSGADAQALTEVASMPVEVQSDLSGNDDYLLTLGAIYSATRHPRWAIATLARLQARYAAQRELTPVDVEIQSSWLFFSAGDEGDLYSTLMRLGSRDDLADGQRAQIQSIWAAWSLRRAAQASAAGNNRGAVRILNAARDALGGNPAVSSSLAGGYLSAGDATTALAIYRSLDLNSAADYQGAIRAALAVKNLKLAENWLRQGLALYRRDGQLLGLAAQFETAHGDNGRARDYWKASLAVSPNTGAADRLALALRSPAAGPKEKGSLLPADTLGSLLGRDTSWSQHTNQLPGEYETAPGIVAEAASEPYLDRSPDSASSSSWPGGRGEALGDYPPQRFRSTYDSSRVVGAPSMQTTNPRPSSLKPVYPTTTTHKRHQLIKRNEARVPVQQAAPLLSPAPVVDAAVGEGRLQVKKEALFVAPGESNPMLHDLVFSSLGANTELPQRVLLSGSAGSSLKVRYASAVQTTIPQQPEAAAPRRDLPQGTGLSDQQLIDSQLPPLRGNYVPALPAPNGNQEAREQVEAIDGGLSPWLGGTGAVRHRSGTSGFDQLTALEAPFEASTPLGMNGRLTGIATPVILDNGVADGTSSLILGTSAVGAKPPQQNADGVATEVQLTAFNFAARVGQTPYGFLVKNITGGVRWRPAGGPLTFAFSRDGSKETQLAYSGMRDPGSVTPTFAGNIWGGVVINAGDVQIAHGDGASGFYAGVGGQYITGRHVLTNNRFHGSAGAYWRLLTRPNYGSLVLGAGFFDMHYAHNIRYFTYGQGGYFSPEAYFLAAMPLTWAGHYGPDLHYNVRASIGAQGFHEDAEPYYPLDPKLQAAAGHPMEPVLSSVGANYDLQLEIAYRVQDHWYIGGFLDASNTRDYLSQSGGFFVRYLFRPQPESDSGPIGAFPRDGFRPVLVP